MNKGINLAKGEIVGIINSDDFYANNKVLNLVANTLSKDVQACYGDLVYVDREDINKQVRYWKSGLYNENKLTSGWIMPHPTFFVKKSAYDRYGLFRTDLWTSADYELVLRFLEKNKLTSSYIPKVLTVMRNGGSSSKSLFNWIRGNIGSYKAFKINGLKVGPLFIFRKPFNKIRQFL